MELTVASVVHGCQDSNDGKTFVNKILDFGVGAMSFLMVHTTDQLEIRRGTCVIIVSTNPIEMLNVEGSVNVKRDRGRSNDKEKKGRNEKNVKEEDARRWKENEGKK